MRRTVVAVVAALSITIVLLLVGCGGGATTESTTSGTGATGSSAAPPPPPTTVSTATPELSAKPITTPRPFPKVDSRNAPKAVLDALAAKRAFMVVFYDSNQVATGDEKAVIDSLAGKFRGLLDFITYDIGVLSRAAEGTPAKQTAQLAADLAQKLDAGYQPAIVIVDKNGLILWQSTGFYDAGTLEREILRATQ
jgi:hypothetical protein